jgi:Tfp pilus assembly protein PilX
MFYRILKMQIRSRADGSRPGKAPRRRISRNGTALLVCLFVLAITTALVMAVLDTTTLQLTAVRNTGDYDKALYLAGAGVNHALAMLEADSSWRTGIASTQFPSGSGNTYSATAVDGTGGAVVVTGTGIAGSTTRKLQVTVTFGS